MIWTLLSLILAWGSARLIKLVFSNAHFSKPTAFILAIFLGLFWVIGGAFLFEYIVGVGTYNKNMLVLQLFSACIVSYYGIKTPLAQKKVHNQVELPSEFINLKNSESQQLGKTKSNGNIFKSLFLLKIKSIVLLSLTVGFLIFTISLTITTISINGQWVKEYQAFEASKLHPKPVFCEKLANNLDLTTEELKTVPSEANLIGLVDSTGKTIKCEETDKIDKIICEVSKNSALEEIGCLSKAQPSSQSSYWKSNLDLEKMISLSFFIVIVVFILLLAGHNYLSEKHLGWKRLSVVLGGLLSIFSLMYISLNEDGLTNSELLSAFLICLILIPALTILTMINGKIVFQWVKSGFTEK